MGNTLSAATQWTSAKSDGVGRLEYTPVNELILNRIAEFTLNFSRRHPEESQVVFRKPMTWMSCLVVSRLIGIGYSLNDAGDVVSNEANAQGHPLLILRKLKSGCEMKVSSLFYLGMALSVAEDQLAEVRTCVEANRDPLSVILGDRFSTVHDYDNTVSRFIDDVISQTAESADVKDKKLVLRLLFLLKEFDDHLMKESVETISKEVKLSPLDVDRIIDLLSKISGDSTDISVLRSIHWMRPYTFMFNNGCRAPFWRQIHGDISYIEAAPHDGPTLYITASTNGYFLNKGPARNDEHNFERDSSLYRDLTTLLRSYSKVFDALIGERKIFELWKNAEGQEKKIKSTKDSGRDIPKATAGGQLNAGAPQADQVSLSTKGAGSLPKDSIVLTKLKPKLNVRSSGRKTKERKVKSKTKFAVDTKPEKNKLKLEKWLEESSSSEDGDGDGPPEKVHYDHKTSAVELSTDHWYIQKLIKYIRGGNYPATIIALCNLRDLNLRNEMSAASIRDTGGLEVLVNLLECNYISCQIGSLKILNEISFYRVTRLAFAVLGGVQLLIRLLHHWNDEIVWLAASLIGQVATTSYVRRIIRVQRGIRKLVALLDIPSSYSGFRNQEGLKISAELSSHKIGKGRGFLESIFKERWDSKLHVAQCAAHALANCANSKRTRTAMRIDGVIPLLTRLLGANNNELLIPLVGIIKEFAKEAVYRASIYSEGMIPDLVKTLKSDNHMLQKNSAFAIFKCADDEVIRDKIRQSGGLEPLVALLNLQTKPEILLPVTGAIWRLSHTRENLNRFQKMDVVSLLIPFLTGQAEQVVVHVVGALAELTKADKMRKNFHTSGGLDLLLQLQTTTKPQLLINVNNTIAECAKDIDCTELIVKKDGVRLLWSALKNPCPQAQASATWALSPCIRNAKDSAELVRSFVGGLELLVNLLKSSHTNVIAGTCAAIATVAMDDENLAVLSDNGVVIYLSKLTCTNDEIVQEHLADAIAQCCSYASNREAFGKEDAVVPLVKYLKCNNQGVHRTTAEALHQLSKFQDNCVTMHANGSVPLLIGLVSSPDRVTQESAAKCLYNIRRLALANQIADDIIN